MSLLDLAGQLTGGQTGGNAALINTVLGMVNSHPGGLPGLLSAFEQQGLGGVVNSWVGTGANQPVSSQQVEDVLGSHRIQEAASNMGVSPETASTSIAQMLPGIIDHLTPNGQVPGAGSNLLELGAGLLQRFMK